MTSGSELTWQAAAAANLLEARKKNGRLGRKKSRAGCLTCKTRRVKCDERKPECERCTSTGRKCDGYASTIAKKTHSSLIGGQLSQSLGLRDSDRRTFDYFLSWTAPRLAGSLDKLFWCGQILQLARAEPIVVNSLLAISILYEHPQFLLSFHKDSDKALSFSKITVPPPNKGVDVSRYDANFENQEPYEESLPSSEPDGPSGAAPARPRIDQNHAVALRHYNRAIESFKIQMQEGRATPWLALVSCVLFICIELLRDQVFGALNLFAKGLGLLHQVSINPKGVDQQLLKTIKLMFGRMALLVAVFGYPLEAPQEFIDMSNVRVFSNAEDARTALWALMFESHAFIRDAARYKASIGYEEPQDPRAFDPGPKPPNLMAETGQAVLPPSLGVSARNTVTRLYLGCLPEDTEVAASAESFRKSFMSDDGNSQPSSVTGAGLAHDIESDEDNKLYDLPFRNTPPDSRATSEHPSPGPSSQSTNSPGSHKTPATSPSMSDHSPTPKKDIIDIAERPLWQVPPRLLEQQIQVERRLGQWYDAFQWIRNDDEEVMSSLLMHYHVSFIWQTTRLAPHQTVFDQYTFHFQQIIHMAEIFVKAKAIAQPMFTFEIGVVPPLYFLITKCRVPSLRRKGLELMSKAPRKECMFGSKSCAELAARLVAIEEENLGFSLSAVDDSILPPEEDRVQSYEIMQDHVAGRYDVRVTRYRVGNSGRLQKTITDYPV